MGFDNDCILNISTLVGEYFCPVCHLLVYPNEALQAQCTHLYCKPCLTYVVSTTHACPYDGYRVVEADAKPLMESNKALAETIGKIQVHCLYFRTGCTWQGSLSDSTSHCSTCAFGESAVLCNRCGIQIVHRQVQEHAQSCPGAPSQTQQTTGAQDTSSVATGATASQNPTTTQTNIPASQAQAPQASAPVVGQDANQSGTSAPLPQAAQAAVPTPEQWYQQQQQYQQQCQQYYQQYPGYDPYQQQYQGYYYAYPQAAAQQYPQPPTQGYPPQAQAQPQVYGQIQPQPQLPAQQQVQLQTQPPLQQQPLIPSQAVQSQLQPQAQQAVNTQTPAQTVEQAQVQMQVNNQAPPSQAMPYNLSQPYAQPQPVQQQQMQVPQYQQTNPQMQHPHTQPYQQSQIQPYLQTQQQQPHSQLNPMPPAHPPSQPNQSMAVTASQNSVTGYQSYPQPQLHPQAQVGAAQPAQTTAFQQQPQYPTHMQGQFPAQASQMRPPQPYAAVPNQQHSAVQAVQGQFPSALPVQQPPPQAQQPGNPYQQRPSVQAAQQAVPQQYMQQPYPGQGPYMQQHPSMQHPLPSQSQSQQNNAAPHGALTNVAQNYASRQMAPHGAGSHPYPQAPGLSGQTRPMQQNQTYQQHIVSQNSKPQGGEKPRSEKSVQDGGVHNKVAKDMLKAGNQVEQMKQVKSENEIDGGVDGNNNRRDLSFPSSSDRGTESKRVENGVDDGQLRMKNDKFTGVSEPSSVSSAAKSVTEDHKNAIKKAGSNTVSLSDQVRDQQQPMHYGPSGSQRPGLHPKLEAVPHPGNPQQGHPPNNWRPQGPGQVPPGPSVSAADGSLPPMLRQPPGSVPPEISAGSFRGPSPSGPFAKPGNVDHYPGHAPYQAGQPPNTHAEPFVRPSFTGQRSGPYDRNPLRRPELEQHPQYAQEMEKFPPPRPGYFDNHGPVERGPYGPVPPGGQAGNGKFSGSSAHDSFSASGIRDERIKSFPEDHLKPFPHGVFGDDMRNFPKPSHPEAGSSSRHLDRGPPMFGRERMLGPLEKGPHVLFDRDPGLKMDSGNGSGPSRLLPPFYPDEIVDRGLAPGFPDDNMRRPDFRFRPDFPGPRPGADFGRPHIDGVPPRSPEQFRKGIPDSRFPYPPDHIHSGERDGPGNLRIGDHMRRDEHLGSRHFNLRGGAALGPGNRARMGELPIPGRFPPLPFGESFGGERPGHPLVGEPGFRDGFGFQRQVRGSGFYPGEMDPFDNARKRNLGIMCRICKVECGTVEGLELHSQSRDHQRRAMDMALSIKQQNKKKQKTSNDQESFGGRDGSKMKNTSFEGRGKMR